MNYWKRFFQTVNVIMIVAILLTIIPASAKRTFAQGQTTTEAIDEARSRSFQIYVPFALGKCDNEVVPLEKGYIKLYPCKDSRFSSENLGNLNGNENVVFAKASGDQLLAAGTGTINYESLSYEEMSEMAFADLANNSESVSAASAESTLVLAGALIGPLGPVAWIFVGVAAGIYIGATIYYVSENGGLALPELASWSNSWLENGLFPVTSVTTGYIENETIHVSQELEGAPEYVAAQNGQQAYLQPTYATMEYDSSSSVIWQTGGPGNNFVHADNPQRELALIYPYGFYRATDVLGYVDTNSNFYGEVTLNEMQFLVVAREVLSQPEYGSAIEVVRGNNRGDLENKIKNLLPLSYIPPIEEYVSLIGMSPTNLDQKRISYIQDGDLKSLVMWRSAQHREAYVNAPNLRFFGMHATSQLQEVPGAVVAAVIAGTETYYLWDANSISRYVGKFTDSPIPLPFIRQGEGDELELGEEVPDVILSPGIGDVTRLGSWGEVELAVKKARKKVDQDSKDPNRDPEKEPKKSPRPIPVRPNTDRDDSSKKCGQPEVKIWDLFNHDTNRHPGGISDPGSARWTKVELEYGLARLESMSPQAPYFYNWQPFNKIGILHFGGYYLYKGTRQDKDNPRIWDTVWFENAVLFTTKPASKSMMLDLEPGTTAVFPEQIFGCVKTDNNGSSKMWVKKTTFTRKHPINRPYPDPTGFRMLSLRYDDSPF